jgi:hypothetical protein
MIGERICPVCGQEGTRIIQDIHRRFETFWLCEGDFPRRSALIEERLKLSEKSKSGW